MPDFRRTAWRVAVLILAAAAATAYYVHHPQRQVRTVSALLHVAGTDERTAAGPTDPQARADAAFRQTQARLLQTRPVLRAALEQPAVTALGVVREQPDPLAWLERGLAVEVRDPTGTVRVSLSGDRPDELAAVVDAVVQAYFRQVVDAERRQREARLAECERLYQENAEAASARLAEVQALHRRAVTGHTAGEIDRRLAVERAAALQKELDDLALKLDRARLQLAWERKKENEAAADQVPDALVDEQLEKDPQARRLAREKDRLERLLADYARYANDGPNTPDLVRSSLTSYRADLKAVRQQYDRLRDQARARLERQLRPGHPAARQTVQQLEEQLALWTGEEKLLRGRLEACRQDLVQLADRTGPELDALLKEVERRQEVVRTLGRQCEALRQELRAPPRVTLVQPAGEPGA